MTSISPLRGVHQTARRAVAAALGVAIPLTGAAALIVAPARARADEHHFTFTYESAVLPRGGLELELWTTPRLFRDDFYARFDQRVELEYGLADRLQTSLYLNFDAISADTPAGDRQTELEFAGVSSEWKYKLLDPVADRLGLAAYGELTASPDEVELEAKLIVDKRVGRALLAGNLVAEQEWELGGDETESELLLVVDLAATYRFSSRVSAGVEVVNQNTIPSGEGLEHSTLSAGPVVAYAADSWSIAATVLPQLPALKTAEGASDSSLELIDHERLVARLLLSFQL